MEQNGAKFVGKSSFFVCLLEKSSSFISSISAFVSCDGMMMMMMMMMK